MDDDDVKSLKSVSDGVPELNQEINVELKVDPAANKESNDIEKVIDLIDDVPQELDTIKNTTEFQDGDD